MPSAENRGTIRGGVADSKALTFPAARGRRSGEPGLSPRSGRGRVRLLRRSHAAIRDGSIKGTGIEWSINVPPASLPSAARRCIARKSALAARLSAVRAWYHSANALCVRRASQAGVARDHLLVSFGEGGGLGRCRSRLTFELSDQIEQDFDRAPIGGGRLVDQLLDDRLALGDLATRAILGDDDRLVECITQQRLEVSCSRRPASSRVAAPSATCQFEQMPTNGGSHEIHDQLEH
jgi:hypothetical protein